MGMAVTVKVDQVMDAMVARLRAERAPATGAGTTADKYLRYCDRYAGQLADPQKALSDFVGRGPAMLVAFAGEELIRTTVGRKVDKVRGTFVVCCISDVHRTEKDRKDVYGMLSDARSALANRALGLSMQKLQPAAKVLSMLEHPQLVAYGQPFTSHYHVNHTRTQAWDLLTSIDAKVLDAKTTFNPPVAAPAIAVIGTLGATALAYKIVALDAEGRRTLASSSGSTATGPAVLSGADFARVTWAAVPGAVLYEVYRTTAGGTPNTVGKLAVTSLLTLDDTGLAADGQPPLDPVYVPLARTY